MRTLEEITAELEEARTSAREARRKVSDLKLERMKTSKRTKLMNLFLEILRDKNL
jgi:cob(I)alamin adenosyltransferase